jgi:hypothetical protein
MGFMMYRYPIICSRVAVVALFLLSVFQVHAENCDPGTPLTGGKQHCSSNGNGKMTGDYSWTIWSSGSGGCITTYDGSGCAFKATWNNSGDFLARTGLGWNETKTYDQLGPIEADYAFKKSGSGGNWSFIGIYGWSNNPLIEYYIVEDWFGSLNIYQGAKKGTITVDGEKYDVLTHTQSNQPSIHGNATFQQYFSARQKPRQCGHISISEHFKQWDKMGLKLGKMYEARILVEAAGGSGTVDFSKATMTAGSPTRSIAPETTLGRSAFWKAKGRGVISLVSLTGTVLRSVRQNDTQPATISTDNLAKGLYLLQFKGEGKAPETRPFLLK